MDKLQKERIISQYYFNAKQPGSYVGAVKLQQILRKKILRSVYYEFHQQMVE